MIVSTASYYKSNFTHTLLSTHTKNIFKKVLKTMTYTTHAQLRKTVNHNHVSRSSRPGVFCKKVLLKNFTKFTEKAFELGKVFKNIFFYRKKCFA